MLRAAMVAVAGLALVAAGCSSDGGSDASPTTTMPTTTDATTTATGGFTENTLEPAPAGFHAVTVTVRNADGTTSTRCLLVADTDTLHQQGLMGVTDDSLAGYDGMIFVFEKDTSSAFWMKNTLIPLSIAFAASDGGVVSTADMVPCPAGTQNCPTTKPAKPYRYAVEVPSGRLPDVGLVDGASLDPTFGPACTR